MTWHKETGEEKWAKMPRWQKALGVVVILGGLVALVAIWAWAITPH